MAAYNFDPQFAGPVERREKCQTIRKPRARGHARRGDVVQLFTLQRTRDCKKIGEGVCTVSTYCAIREDGITLGKHPRIDLDKFAQLDGFPDYDAMKEWFRNRYGLPFIGHLIRWEPLPPPPQDASHD